MHPQGLAAVLWGHYQVRLLGLWPQVGEDCNRNIIYLGVVDLEEQLEDPRLLLALEYAI